MWREAMTEALDILAQVFDGTGPRDQAWYGLSRKITDATEATRRDEERTQALEIELAQYKDAHEHSQQLRALAERRAYLLRRALDDVWAMSNDPKVCGFVRQAQDVDEVLRAEADKPFESTRLRPGL